LKKVFIAGLHPQKDMVFARGPRRELRRYFESTL
jgi:hypothetical protein